jgi:ElaB/YqjD/DUF883 family membrane-anchored ribosome-binding protein
MTETAKSTERLVTDLQRVASDSRELLHNSVSATGEQARATRERLGEALESATVACRQLEEKARQCVKATDKAVRAHPYQSIGVAFGLGLLIGVLMARKLQMNNPRGTQSKE